MAISAAVLGPRGLKAVEEENAQTALETAQRGSVEADTRHFRIPQTPPLSPGWATAVACPYPSPTNNTDESVERIASQMINRLKALKSCQSLLGNQKGSTQLPDSWASHLHTAEAGLECSPRTFSSDRPLSFPPC